MVSLEDAEKDWAEAQKFIKTNVLAGRLKPDWEKALPKLERAVTGFKLAKRHESAREVYEKIAQAQERLGSDWHAGQAYENAARMSKLAGNDQDMFECVLHAAEYYNKAGRMNYAAEAYARGAKMIEETNFKKALKLYKEAINLMEEDGKDTLTGDMFRNCVAACIRAEEYEEATTLLIRFGEGFQNSKNYANQAKCYLGAIVVFLYGGMPQRAWELYQEVLEIEHFSATTEAQAAENLFDAYANEDSNRIKVVVKNSGPFQFLDAGIGRLAGKLPTGDFKADARTLDHLMNGDADAEDLGDDLT